MGRNYFITFEGIDGSGKETQLHRLVGIAQSDDNLPFGGKHANIWITREPTTITQSGRMIACLIREGKLTVEEATKYFIQDRKEHSTLIEDVMWHSHVFCSRYDLATLSYQAVQGMAIEELYALHDFERRKCRIPDVTIVFDVPAEVAHERLKKKRWSSEMFETLDFQQRVIELQQEAIALLRKKGRHIIVVNGNQNEDMVAQEMITKLSKTLRLLS